MTTISIDLGVTGAYAIWSADTPVHLDDLPIVAKRIHAAALHQVIVDNDVETLHIPPMEATCETVPATTRCFSCTPSPQVSRLSRRNLCGPKHTGTRLIQEGVR